MSNTLILPVDAGKVSDGYHTFEELYNHRCLLWVNVLQTHKDKSFKTWRNDSGQKWNGWFIAGINTEFGQITYHLPEELWPYLDIQVKERNDDYDGHTSKDVLSRLKLLAASYISSIHDCTMLETQNAYV
ncbi:MAG: hypothetical protein JAY71_18775 [Candidatus Thiodiazotropha weberae]|nr:hypothetical protein [Candidatus Thiodiazotropha weberae]